MWLDPLGKDIVLRSHPRTPGRYPGCFTKGLWRNFFLFRGPRVCGQNHWIVRFISYKSKLFNTKLAESRKNVEKVNFQVGKLGEVVVGHNSDRPLSPNWRSLKFVKGHLTIPQKDHFESPGSCFFLKMEFAFDTRWLDCTLKVSHFNFVLKEKYVTWQSHPNKSLVNPIKVSSIGPLFHFYIAPQAPQKNIKSMPWPFTFGLWKKGEAMNSALQRAEMNIAQVLMGQPRFSIQNGMFAGWWLSQF